MNEEFIRIEDVVYVLKKRWKIILSVTLVTTSISAIVSFFLIEPKYQAETKLFIGKENTMAHNEYYDNNDVQMYQKLLKTYAEVIQTKDLVGQAIGDSKLELKPEDVLSNFTVTPRVDTQILEISYINENPVVSQEIVKSVAERFIKYSPQLIPNGEVKIIENVKVPEHPVSPNKKMNIAIAFFLGLMISIGISFLIEFMDNIFKTKQEIECILDLPAIGVIPNELNFE